MRALLVPILLTVSVGCASRPNIATDAEADELLKEARAFEAEGECIASAELYLDCLAYCPAPTQLVGPDLNRVSRACPTVEPTVWAAVRRVEDRVISAEVENDEFSTRLYGLVSVYQGWNRPERAADLLKRAKQGLPLQLYAEAVKILVSQLPEGFSKLDEHDAVMLVIDAQRAPLWETMMVRMGSLGTDTANELERGRLTDGAGYAMALLRSGHRDAAGRVVQAALEGVKEPRCRKLVWAAEQRQSPELLKLVCDKCSEEAQCRAVSSRQGSEQHGMLGN